MDWPLALKLNQDVLLRNVAWLFTWLKLEVGASIETMPRFKRLTILFVLRPSESAFRRLIFVAVLVHGVTAPMAMERAMRSGRPRQKSGAERRERCGPPPFKLTDPRKNFDLYPNRPKRKNGIELRITDLWSDDPVYDRSDLYAYQERQNRAQPTPDDAVSASILCLRMNALMNALQDLPGQAHRMAKLLARIERTKEWRLRPLRPGLPPGYRQRQKHEVDEVLAECHRLALSAQQDFKPPDTG